MPELTGNNVIRLGVISGLKLIPYAGGLLGGLTDMLWPTDGKDPLKDLQQQMKSLPQQTFDAVRLDGLNTSLSGLQLLVDEWKTASSVNDKRTKFGAIEIFTTDCKPTFYEQDDMPSQTLPLLVAFGSIRLSCLAERVNHYEEVIGDKPDDPAKLLTTWEQEFHALMVLVSTYRQNAYRWRTGCVTITAIPQSTRMGTGDADSTVNFTWTTYSLRDSADPSFAQDFQSRPFYFNSVEDPIAAQNLVNKARFNHLWDLTTKGGGFMDMLDQAIDAFRYWRCMVASSRESAVYPSPTPVNYYWCMRVSDGLSAGGTDWSHAQLYHDNGPITSIELVTTNDRLLGLVAQYGNVDSDPIGPPGAVPGQMSGIYPANMDVGSTDGIVYISCTDAAASIPRFQLATNLMKGGSPDKTIIKPIGTELGGSWSNNGGGGHMPLSPFTNRIAYFAGTCDEDGAISQLKIVWVRRIDFDVGLHKQNLWDAASLENLIGF